LIAAAIAACIVTDYSHDCIFNRDDGLLSQPAEERNPQQKVLTKKEGMTKDQSSVDSEIA
jgi:hypothetical protein